MRASTAAAAALRPAKHPFRGLGAPFGCCDAGGPPPRLAVAREREALLAYETAGYECIPRVEEPCIDGVHECLLWSVSVYPPKSAQPCAWEGLLVRQQRKKSQEKPQFLSRSRSHHDGRSVSRRLSAVPFAKGRRCSTARSSFQALFRAAWTHACPPGRAVVEPPSCAVRIDNKAIPSKDPGADVLTSS